MSTLSQPPLSPTSPVPLQPSPTATPSTATPTPPQPTTTPTPTTAQPGRRGPVLIATNTVTTKDGLTVRARIDPTLSVADVIKQLCLNLKIPGNPVLYALRDAGEKDELVTDENLRAKIKDKAALKLTSAPLLEAMETIDKLQLRDEKTLRLCLFNLQKYIKEEQFANEFLARDGLRELCEVIVSVGGNTLAYALTALSNLLDLPYGWSALSPQFIYKIVLILASPNNLVNVCRPATLILKKLVEADGNVANNIASSSSGAGKKSEPSPGSVYRFGFDVVYEQMRHERNLLEIVVGRLGGSESLMVLYSMTLLNSLLSHATPAHWVELTSALERLNTSRAVIRLMSSHTIEDLTNSILDYQGNMVRVLYFKKTRRVHVTGGYSGDQHDDYASGGGDAEQEAMLEYIWAAGKLEVDVGPGQVNSRGKGSMRDVIKWRKLGFQSEDVRRDFEHTGMLGLECLRHFVQADPSRFAQLVLEQNSRAMERRCPIARASNEVVEILSDHWSIFAPGYSTSTTFQPFFLSFYKVHALALHFFLRMWSDSGAAASDFPRVASLARSQVKAALQSETERPWHEVEQDFLESEYRAVRDRQMKELELEDDLLTKVPVRNLRAKLYKESYEFIRQQRIQCLIQGAWFVNGAPVSQAQSPAATQRRQGRPWRYMRLDRNLKVIHFCDSALKFPVRSGLEDLPERIDVSLIGEIAINTCALPPGVNIGAGASVSQQLQDPGHHLVASPISFSLISVKGESIGDHVATDLSRWADWTDGLNMLRRDGGHVATSETAGYVHSLTEIGLKIKLLDLSGEKVDIPSSLMPGSPPADTNFFFSDL
ncbi:hypothetical protein M408DRAFT_330723 [Serendipita vermifera MAFF 305830]|uniref:ELMO domain-containing protein n=1 Tax=Serendipita vermifera MAFF 305830 TaxID=933852 RepID=A0A0C2XAD6_SERVB|nr:hypothetical protein M408DRAFT_330723 [Serendipita vermifera MAFF 305830]